MPIPDCTSEEQLLSPFWCRLIKALRAVDGGGVPVIQPPREEVARALLTLAQAVVFAYQSQAAQPLPTPEPPVGAG